MLFGLMCFAVDSRPSSNQTLDPMAPKTRFGPKFRLAVLCRRRAQPGLHSGQHTHFSSSYTQPNNTQNQAHTGKARRERTAYIDKGGAKTTSPGESQVRHK